MNEDIEGVLPGTSPVSDWPFRTFLEAAYQAILQRPPDPDGLANFLRDEAQLTPELVIAIMMQSAEFRDRFFSDPDIAVWVGAQAQRFVARLDPLSAKAFEVPPLHVPIGSRRYKIFDYPGAPTARLVARELHYDGYRLKNLALPEVPVIVDIGAHIGLFSLEAESAWPKADILAFEPTPTTFALLEANLEVNGSRVRAFNHGVSGAGEDILIQVDPWGNSGAASAHYRQSLPFHAEVTAKTLSLDQLMSTHGLSRIDLLKLDCEGSEYDILNAFENLGDRVGHLRVEIHDSLALAARGYAPEVLIRRLDREMGPDRYHAVFANKRPEELRASRSVTAR